MLGDRVVQLAVAVERELQPDAHAVQRRVAGAQHPHARRGGAHAPELVAVLDGLDRDVVAEPSRLLVRVGMTADVDEQGGVVDDRALLLVEPHALGDPQRDEALAEHVLHRLAETEVDAERKRRYKLGQSNVRTISLAWSDTETRR